MTKLHALSPIELDQAQLSALIVSRLSETYKDAVGDRQYKSLTKLKERLEAADAMRQKLRAAKTN